MNFFDPSTVLVIIYNLLALRRAFVGEIKSCTKLSTASNVEVSGTVGRPSSVLT